MKNIVLMIAVLLLTTACSTLNVEVDYDSSFDFNSKQKYAVIHSDRVGDNTLVNDRIINAIQNSLNAKEYEAVTQSEAELLFVFHVNVMEKADVVTDYEMVGYGGYGFGRGYGMGYRRAMVATPSTYRYTEGKLIIDALNPKTKKIVWRGVASDELTRSAQTPEEKTTYINRVVTKLMQSFPKGL